MLGLVFLRPEDFNQLSTALHEFLDPATVDHCRHGCLLLLFQCRAEAKTIYRRDHLLNGDLGGVEGHHCLLRLEAYTEAAVRGGSCRRRGTPEGRANQDSGPQADGEGVEGNSVEMC